MKFNIKCKSYAPYQTGGSASWSLGDGPPDQPFQRLRQILDVEYMSLFHTIPYSSGFSSPVTARCRVAAGELQLGYRFAARDVLTKLHLQECLTTNNSRTKPDIDVISAPQCASQSRDAETCKKSKSENFALTGFLHQMDEMV